MKIAYVKANDWYAIYIDGKIWTQGHSIDTNSWCNLVRKLNGNLEIIEADDEALIDTGEYPDKLEDVKRV